MSAFYLSRSITSVHPTKGKLKMHPILLQLGPLTLHSYGLMVALGFLSGIALSIYLLTKSGLDGPSYLDLAIYIMLAAIVGGRAFYVIGMWNYFAVNPLEIIMVQTGGLVYLGGLIFAVLTAVVYLLVRRQPVLQALDAITPGTALGYAIGRIGCFLTGCCFGLPTTLPWGIVFPPASLAGEYCPGQAVHPTQLYSSITMFIVAYVLYRLWHRRHNPGEVLCWGLFLYSLYRFLVEFLRYSPIHWAGLTPSQWLGLVIGSGAAAGLFYLRRQHGKV